jgi:arylformamidase
MWDITLPFREDLPCWPGDPIPTIEKVKDMAKGDSCQVTQISTNVHMGTHIDAPIHFVEGGKDIASLSLDVLMGTVFVVELLNKDKISVESLEEANIPSNITRLLIKTNNSALWENLNHTFISDYVALTPDAAQWIVEQGIQLVGIDYLSIERFKENDNRTHKILLEKEVIVVEGLDLSKIESGYYQLVCLPIKLVGSDGAPARVILKKE